MVLPMPSSASVLLGRALERGRVLERARADDAAGALGEPGHRVLGADAARVGQRDRGAGEVGGGQLVAAGAGHHVFVGREELGEGHRVGALDVRNEQRARAVGLGQVDRDAEVDVRGHDDARLAVGLGVRHVLAREHLEGLHDRPADEVGERDLAAACAAQVVVDDDAVVDHQLGRARCARWSPSAR